MTTRMMLGRLIPRFALALAALAVPTYTHAQPQTPPLAEFFGFQRLEIYKLDDRINVLVVEDLDGDKIADIALANNGRSRIDLLLSTPGPSDETATSGANLVPSSKRMRLKSIPVNREVASIVAGDLDGDNVTDLAYYGSPAEIVLLHGEGNGTFTESRKINAGEGISAPTALALTDINRDGRSDLVLLGPTELISLLQRADGRLGEPERVPHTANRPAIFKALDLDGDGGDDLVMLDSGNDDPIRVRFSTAGGNLGPEERFAVESPRAIAFAELDGKPGQELLMVEGQSGRVRVLSLTDSATDDATKRGRLLFFPLPSGETRNRSLALGDVDGDKHADVVVTDPGNAQILLYLQEKTGLVHAQTFPNLAGARGVAIADIDGDGSGEVLVLSEQEKAIGWAKFRDGRLSFPSPLPITGEPVALVAGDLNNDSTPEVIYVARAPQGSSGNFVLRALSRDPSGVFKPFLWNDSDAVPIPGLTGTPPALRILDINRDGHNDFLIFRPFGAPILLLGKPDGQAPTALEGNLGPLVAATPSGISTDAPGDASLLVAQSGFARAIALGDDGQWQVKDQFNADRGSAQISGATTLDLNGDGSNEVVLYDRGSKSLIFLDERDGVYRRGGTLSVGSFDFQGMYVADLDGDSRDDLLIAGSDRFAVVSTGQRGRKFESLAGYDSTRPDALLGDLIAGDVNGDGRTDIIVSDIGDNALEILAFDGKSSLQRALAFKIFEKKSFRDRDSLVEPRDIALGDVDGDGRTDIILICHDRVLIYRQDSGVKPAGPAAVTAGD